MAETQTQTIAGVEVIFYPNSHRYKVGKSWIPSVTTIIGMIDKSRVLLKWSENLCRDFLKTVKTLNDDIIEQAVTQYATVRDEAGNTGTQVHDFIEAFAEAKRNRTELPKINDNWESPVLNGVLSFLKWNNENTVEYLQGEKLVYSPQYNYVGKYDRILIVNGVKFLADWKTGKGIYKEVELQLNAYEQALYEETGEHIDDLMVLHCNKETGDFKVYEYKRNPFALEVFTSLINLKDFLK